MYMELQYCDTIVATALIPELLYEKISGTSFSTLVMQMLNTESIIVSLRHLKSGSPRISYQTKNLRLRRINFRIPDIAWGILSEISVSTGYSRCYILVKMIGLYLRIKLNEGKEDREHFIPAVNLPASKVETRRIVNVVARVLIRVQRITIGPD